MVIFLLFALFSTACVHEIEQDNFDIGNASGVENSSQVQTESSIQQNEQEEDVNAVLSVVIRGEEFSIEEYVENLKASEPEQQYEVYDDAHYIRTIKESERKENLELLLSETNIENVFIQLYEEYQGVFVDMEYTDLFQSVSFYVDKSKYNEVGLI